MKDQLRSKGFAAAALGLVVISAQTTASYDFKDPAVLNLTSAASVQPHEQGDPLPLLALPADAARAISAAVELSDGAHGVVPYLDSDNKAAHKLEQQTIAAEAGAVQRAGKKLSLKTQAGKTAEFVDHKIAPSKDADGDSETFVYAGRIGAANYYRVEERFDHGPPGAFVINPVSGAVAFADYGEEVLAAAPDGSRLMAVGTNDLLITVAVLGAAGPQVELACSYHDGPQVAFKGWHDNTSFDLLLSSEAASSDKPAIAAPVRVSLQGDAWTVATSNPAALKAWAFVCRKGAK